MTYVDLKNKVEGLSIWKVKKKLEIEKLTDDYGRFVVYPLERGFATTLGNVLRRVLLSSLEGASATYVKIQGVTHEFSSIEGVLEDVPDIILNIKRIDFSLRGTEPRVIILDKKIKGEVKAGDFQLPPEVEILNPDLVIATITADNVRLYMEIGIEKGVGYRPVEKQEFKDSVIGLIPLDSFFSPIKKVNFFVEDTRVEQDTEYEKLILEIWTNKTIKPDKALSDAAYILNKYVAIFEKFRDLDVEDTKLVKEEEQEQESSLSIKIEEMNLSARSYNCLKRAGVNTVADILQYSETSIMNIRNFGKKSLKEIKDKLAEYGLQLKKD